MNFEIMLDDHPVRKQALPKYKKLNLQSYQTRLLLMIQLEKKHSQTKKNRFKSVDILRFSKGLTHDFGQNWEFHLSLFLDKMSIEVKSDDHPSRKLALLN